MVSWQYLWYKILLQVSWGDETADRLQKVIKIGLSLKGDKYSGQNRYKPLINNIKTAILYYLIAVNYHSNGTGSNSTI